MTTTRSEAWKPIPGFTHYEASDMGNIRSVPRVVAGRRYEGVVLKARVSNKGYALINVRDDDGKVQTRTVHTLVLSAFAGPRSRGQEARHLDDNPLNNSWPENLAWGTPADNVADRLRNTPREPKPERHCIRCGAVVTKGGRRCHECVVIIGKHAARMLAKGASLAAVCEALEYPSAEGIHTLAVKYGGYAAPPRPRWSQRVMATVRGWFGRGDSR